MGNTVKKMLTILMIVLMMPMLFGCKDSANTSEAKGANKEPDATIKMITWTNDSTIEALKIINERFLEEAGIAVEITDVPATDYEAFLKERIASGDVDIFCYTTDSKAFAQPVVDWAPSEMLTWESIINDGNALDISGFDFVNNWSTGAEACRYKDGIYGISTGMTIMNGIFYNKSLFEENGWHEPRTWDEFVSLCKAIEDKGMTPILVGGADTWPVQMITNSIVDSVMEDKCSELSEGLWKGTRTYTDEDSMKIYRRELEMLELMGDGFMDVAYADGPSLLVQGKTAMLYDGSWNAAEIEKVAPTFEYDYFAIPGDTKHNFTGKYDLTFGINAKSPNVEKAVKWLEFFSIPDNYTVYINKNGFVPTMSWISTNNKFLTLIDDRVNDSERTFECYNRVPDNYGFGTYDLINYSIAGGTFDTPEEFAEAAQADWDAAIKVSK